MSQEQSIANRALPDRKRIRVRFEQLRRSRQLSMIGGPELIGLAGALLLALITVFLYAYLYLPASSRQRAAELERERLRNQLHSYQQRFDEKKTTSETINNVSASINDFESNWLIGADSGRMSLYTELNDLIRSNGLRNSSGPSYSTLAPLGTKQQVQATAGAQSNAKWQSVYPGIAVNVTVEGPYQNIRHFVRDIEMSRQFLVINAIELERVTQSGEVLQVVQAPPPRAGRPAPIRGPATPTQRGAMVSLNLDISTYFQRAEGQ